jgi:hypothetical protein
MLPSRFCRHCGYALPEDCPPDANSCLGYVHWRAQRGDLLDDEGNSLKLLGLFCELTVALRDRLGEVPELEP